MKYLSNFRFSILYFTAALGTRYVSQAILNLKAEQEKSVAFYESLMPRIDAEIGSIRLDKLKAKHLDDFYIKLQNRNHVRMSRLSPMTNFLLNVTARNSRTRPWPMLPESVLTQSLLQFKNII